MRKLNHAVRRDEIAAAAAEFIAYKGLEALTTRALAASMGCTIGVLSHYFSNKNQIILAAFNWADSRIDQRIAEAVSDQLSIDDFLPVIRAALPFDVETDMHWRVRFALYASTLINVDELQEQQEKMQYLRVWITELIQGLQDNNEIRADVSAEDVASVIFDLIIGAAQNLLHVPMAKREAQAAPIFKLLETLRV
ncbi:TetR/AcrR family transcriptional regulator [Oceanicoccus sp. KOV_DT_Chl]|uniref:TetR/AcrR family transcriptional regulator n=1 Tax=Oceanicoccus sp. KOV_DT_Chl TaxID=1904639 RepID=UPI000C7A6B15|nr:TetR/AcrR family transcriptional regulator [Oceanicoccus sp. KOV_DT_Chl]